MLNKIAQIAYELDQIGFHDEADILTNLIKRAASMSCPCGLTMLSQDSIDANYCDACDRVLSNVSKTATASTWPDFDSDVETLQYDSEEAFQEGISKHKDNPRLIDIGYSDRIIKLEKPSEREAQAKKPINKPFRTPDGPKKFSVYVNDGDKVKKVNFGDPGMSIKRDNPERRKNFRARHQCDKNPGPKTKARYWSCKMWEAGKSVSDITK